MPSTPAVSASSEDVNMPSAPSPSTTKRAVSLATLRANGFPVRRAQCA
jgi:hypothetical protein